VRRKGKKAGHRPLRKRGANLEEEGALPAHFRNNRRGNMGGGEGWIIFGKKRGGHFDLGDGKK